MRLPLAAAAASLLAVAGSIGSSASTVSARVPSTRHLLGTVQQVQAARARLARNELGVPCEVECLGPMLSGGGPIQHTPAVYIVFWGWHGADPAGEAPYLQNFFNGVGGTGWANIQTQYNGSNGYVANPTGQLKGVWWDDSSTPANPTPDASLGDEAVRAAAHFGYNPDADYFIATPRGSGTTGFAGKGGSYCAYHDSRVNNGQTIAWTNFPYIPDAGASCGQNFVNANGPLDGVSMVGGHEYAEAVTDPVVGTGWTDLTGNETGDKCAWIAAGPGTAANINLSTGTFPVQSLYSNAANLGTVGGCVLSYP